MSSKRHRRPGVVLRVLGYDPDWFTRTLGALAVVAAGEMAWGAELALSGRVYALVWFLAFLLLWLGFLLVIEPGSGKPGQHRHSRR